ncbi:hypothetical protein B0T25DRAFT_20320 [Lasiosphaeria hispida]|uniref:Uncharacterized protein n=1 Tax=Lasiosphaeria hispida TaxID=260671 RepID=A0AAJ0HUH7_9PEZI|nr:hypothetical protein B0T25DRAFT_20320 [Lasiosphaeria hispida]
MTALSTIFQRPGAWKMPSQKGKPAAHSSNKPPRRRLRKLSLLTTSPSSSHPDIGGRSTSRMALALSKSRKASPAVHRRLRVPAKLAPKLANSVPAGPVNPQMSDSQFAASNVMLCPEETGDAISLLGDTDLRDLFSTVEDFADTEMVHAPRQPKAKRRLSISSGPFSNTNKKRARTSTPTPPPTPTEAAPDPKPQPGKQDEEDILDEWIVTDISQIPSYGPSEIMEQQSHQLLRRILLGTAVAKARAARKAVGKMKRRYGSMTKDCLSSFHSGYKPTRCVAVGVAY